MKILNQTIEKCDTILSREFTLTGQKICPCSERGEKRGISYGKCICIYSGRF